MITMRLEITTLSSSWIIYEGCILKAARMSWPISTSLPFENTRELIRDFLNLVFFLVLCYLISIKWSAGIRRVRGTKAFFVEVAVLMMTEVEPVFVHHGSERLRWLCRGFRSWTSRLNHMLPQTNEGCTLSSFSLLSPPASLIMELLSEFCLFSHCQPCLKQRFATLHILSVGNSDEMALLKLFHFMTPERVVKMDVLITTIH